jgi:hypothetical protein
MRKQTSETRKELRRDQELRTYQDPDRLTKLTAAALDVGSLDKLRLR